MKSVGKNDRRVDGQWRRQRLMAVTRGHKASAEAAVDGGDERSQGVGGGSG